MPCRQRLWQEQANFCHSPAQVNDVAFIVGLHKHERASLNGASERLFERQNVARSLQPVAVNRSINRFHAAPPPRLVVDDDEAGWCFVQQVDEAFDDDALDEC